MRMLMSVTLAVTTHTKYRDKPLQKQRKVLWLSHQRLLLARKQQAASSDFVRTEFRYRHGGHFGYRNEGALTQQTNDNRRQVVQRSPTKTNASPFPEPSGKFSGVHML